MTSRIGRFVPNVIRMRARKIVRHLGLWKMKRDSRPVMRDGLVADLRALGLAEGDLIMVHSSLRGLGFVEGGADTVVDALMEVVGSGGTLVFPAFTLAGTMKGTLDRGDYVFDPKRSPSSVGAISNAFLARSAVLRSVHPTHSVAAWGRLAEELTRTHGEMIFKVGYQMPAPTWTLPQMLWLKRNEPGILDRTEHVLFVKDKLGSFHFPS